MNETVDPLPYVDPGIPSDGPSTPGLRARCVDCDAVLIAKCGEINAWHWAHESGGDICTGSDGEGAWHRAWKKWAESKGAETEVTNGRHRADVVWPDGRIYELQSSYLAPSDIRKREECWGEALTWIYRITPGRFDRLTNIGERWFNWRRGAPSMTLHERPIIWHHRDRLYPIETRNNGGRVHIRFITTGQPDRYGPPLPDSEPAPFDVNDAVGALNLITLGFSAQTAA